MLKVNEQSPAVKAMQANLAKVDALMGGTTAMRAAGRTYLPQWPMEKDDAYQFRLATSTLYNAFARTVNNMAGKPFTEPVKATDVDPTIEAWFENIDLAGHNLHVFAHEVFRAGLKDGITHVLIDFPVTRTPDGLPMLRTRADEQAAGVRPYAIHVKQSQILGWISDTVGGAEQLTQLRFMETVSEPDGEFGTKDVQQVRVLTPGAWRTYRANAQNDWVLYQDGTTTLDFIPLVTFYTARTGFMTAVPPLNDLADLNIKHWQSSSDQDAILHVARVPILAISGVDETQKIEVGAKAALMLPVGADVKYVEHSGAAIEAGRMSLQDLEEQMESMGAELLRMQPGDQSATQAALDTAQAQCQLSAMANALEDFLDEMVGVMAKWANLPETGHIDVFDDFATIAVDGMTIQPFITGLVLAVNSGLLSRESAFEEMKRYGVVNPDRVWEDEQDRIQNSGPDLSAIPPNPALNSNSQTT